MLSPKFPKLLQLPLTLTSPAAHMKSAIIQFKSRSELTDQMIPFEKTWEENHKRAPFSFHPHKTKNTVF